MLILESSGDAVIEGLHRLQDEPHPRRLLSIIML